MIIFLKVIALAVLMLSVFILLSILAILMCIGIFWISLKIFEWIEKMIYRRNK
nr:MAG TPA: hypothetical protein [Caudoviricetes sp.]